MCVSVLLFCCLCVVFVFVVCVVKGMSLQRHPLSSSVTCVLFIYIRSFKKKKYIYIYIYGKIQISTAIATRSAFCGQRVGGDRVPICLDRLDGNRDALDPPVTQNRVRRPAWLLAFSGLRASIIGYE